MPASCLCALGGSEVSQVFVARLTSSPEHCSCSVQARVPAAPRLLRSLFVSWCYGTKRRRKLVTPALLNLSTLFHCPRFIFFSVPEASGRGLVVARRLGCVSAISLPALWRPASLPKNALFSGWTATSWPRSKTKKTPKP